MTELLMWKAKRLPVGGWPEAETTRRRAENVGTSSTRGFCWTRKSCEVELHDLIERTMSRVGIQSEKNLVINFISYLCSGGAVSKTPSVTLAGRYCHITWILKLAQVK